MHERTCDLTGHTYYYCLYLYLNVPSDFYSLIEKITRVSTFEKLLNIRLNVIILKMWTQQLYSNVTKFVHPSYTASHPFPRGMVW